jgi:hypothetical protein
MEGWNNPDEDRQDRIPFQLLCDRVDIERRGGTQLVLRKREKRGEEKEEVGVRSEGGGGGQCGPATYVRIVE